MKRKEVVLATRNEGKLREFKRILESFNIDLLSLKAFPDIPEIVEDGSTFEENALKKALTVASSTKRIAIADDSGLMVDYLEGKPGVMSARYAGENAGDKDNYIKLLKILRGVPDHLRTASFKCALAVATPEEKHDVVTGECSGIITHEPRGNAGFGYDPVFYYPEYGKTFAELEPEMKDSVSHRRRAIEKLLLILPRYLEQEG
ncbi:MAG: XTP/dITP diphosphatase [Proteobacteria bacterium]|nr:XTP/dITP diphosphatase [Pseudomonadota bacterium]